MATVAEPARHPDDEVEQLVKLIDSMVDWVGDSPFYVVGKGKLVQMPPYLVAKLRRFRRQRERRPG